MSFSNLRAFNAICPLVTKVHVELAKIRNQAREVVMIGHKGHPEVEGTMEQSRDGMYLVETPEDVRSLKVGTPEKLSFVTQTTLSVDDASVVIAELREQFPRFRGQERTISAMPRKIARMPSRRWPGSANWSSSSAARTAPTRGG